MIEVAGTLTAGAAAGTLEAAPTEKDAGGHHEDRDAEEDEGEQQEHRAAFRPLDVEQPAHQLRRKRR